MKLDRFPLLACLLVCVTGFGLGCDSDDDDDKGGNNGGGSGLAGKFFGGGNSSGGGDSGGGENGGGENPGGGGGEVPGGGGGEVPGGGGGEVPGGGGGGADAASCQAACTSIIQCVVSACGLTASQADLSAAVNECVPGCQSEASAQDLQAVTQLAADNCAGFNALAEQEGLCDDLGDGDIGEGGGGGGGGGVDAGTCAQACQRLVGCCQELGGGAECPTQDVCVQGCTAEGTAEEVACFLNAPTCEAAITQCIPQDDFDEEFPEEDFPEEDF